MEQAFAVGGIASVAAAGLMASNLLYDHGVANSISRYVAPILGRVAFLVASVAIGWGLLGDRWLAFLPIAFMAW